MEKRVRKALTLSKVAYCVSHFQCQLDTWHKSAATPSDQEVINEVTNCQMTACAGLNFACNQLLAQKWLCKGTRFVCRLDWVQILAKIGFARASDTRQMHNQGVARISLKGAFSGQFVCMRCPRAGKG